MPWKLVLAVRETVAGRGLGALEGRGGAPLLPLHSWEREPRPAYAFSKASTCKTRAVSGQGFA